MESVLLCTERKGLESFFKYGEFGTYSMSKTGSRQNLSVTRVNAARLVSSCSAPSQALVLGKKRFKTTDTGVGPENRLKLWHLEWVSCAAEWPETGWGRGHREQHPRLQPQARLQAESQRDRCTHRAPAHVKRPRHEMNIFKYLQFMSAKWIFSHFFDIILKRKF